MSVTIPLGPRTWSHSTDKEGVRTYRVTFRVELSSTLVGPNEIRQAPGLPRPGDVWAFENVPDFWAWCTWEREVSPIQKREGSPTYFADVTCVFSSKAPKKCQDEKFDDPLLQFPIISGGSVRYTEEATVDRFGSPIRNSSHEILKGRTIEFDANRPTIKIKYNVATFDVVTLAYSMQDKLNSTPLWGLLPRQIKLSGVDFEKKYYGLCYPYYELSLEFDIGNAQHGGRPGATTFDRRIADEGTMVLSGKWDIPTRTWTVDTINGSPADPLNPGHFIRATDVSGNPIRLRLDGGGKPYIPTDTSVSVSCGHCNRFPRYFEVFGFDDALNMGYDPMFPPDEVERILMANVESSPGVSTCTWRTDVTVGNVAYTVQLTYNTSTNLWELTNEFYTGSVWNTPNLDFECEGTTELTTAVASSPGPLSVTVLPGNETEPGFIDVEKYGEANFALLGIPLIL